MDLADEDEDVRDGISTIQDRNQGVELVITSTVVLELADAAEKGGEKGELAKHALQSLGLWGISYLKPRPVGNGIVEEVARKIRDRGLVPPDEIHDSLIITEAALCECQMLITSDRHLREFDNPALSELLASYDLSVVFSASPRVIARRFFQQP